MAEIVVNLVIEKLVVYLSEEVKLLKDVHGEFEDIKAELESIRAFLRDADVKAEKTDVPEGVKIWVKEVREVAFCIEDIIDEYMLQVAKHHDKHGLLTCLHKIAQKMKNLKQRYKVAREIQDIKKRVSDINDRRQRYGFNSIDQSGSSSDANTSSWHDPRRRALFVEEAEGIELPRKELITKLVEGDSRRTVISVVGMGGIGKTTLAKKVYDDPAIVAQFDCHAWITVSQSYSTEELLRNIIAQFVNEKREAAAPGIQTMNIHLLTDFLRQYLRDKKYVIVFDDVWKVEFWGDVENALPENKRGSRVMLTTRKEDVAKFCEASSLALIHQMRTLNNEKALELLCKKAFQFEDQRQCPQVLMKYTEDIIHKCGGLPLAIVAIGGLLSTKGNNVSQWEKLCNTLSSELERNPHLEGIKKILSLSYNDLPYYLKSCFLYFFMFPEDHLVSCKRLIRKWVAEGFILSSKGKTLEEVGEEYLSELIGRSLVQACSFKFKGQVSKCRVHDLMRETILSKSEELSFCRTLTKDEGRVGSARRLSIQSNEGSDVVSKTNKSPARSMFLFNVSELRGSFTSELVSNFKLMRTLDFDSAPLYYLPEKIGDLIHLRYLSLRKTKVKLLPKTMANLRNLETLDLRHSQVFEISFEINRLRKLRHLIAYAHDEHMEFSLPGTCGVKIQVNIGDLHDLLTLQTVEVENNSNFSSDLSNLRALEILCIRKLKRESGKELCKAIEKMNHLKSLEVGSTSVDEILDLQHILSPPMSLEDLILKGRLEKFPVWMKGLQTIKQITFAWSGSGIIMDDSLKVLKDLPNLLHLQLRKAYDKEELHFEDGTFQKLKRLILMELNGLKRLIIDREALHCLEVLEIGCPQLMQVPSGIQYLRNLKNLEFNDMAEELVASIVPRSLRHPTSVLKGYPCDHPHRGQSYEIVAHVPKVRCHIKQEGGQYFTFNLGRAEVIVATFAFAYIQDAVRSTAKLDTIQADASSDESDLMSD